MKAILMWIKRVFFMCLFTWFIISKLEGSYDPNNWQVGGKVVLMMAFVFSAAMFALVPVMEDLTKP